MATSRLNSTGFRAGGLTVRTLLMTFAEATDSIVETSSFSASQSPSAGIESTTTATAESTMQLDELHHWYTVENKQQAADAIWILNSTFIIFTMQSGFGLLESGSVRTKNEVNIMVKNAADVIFGGLTFWLFGYAFSFGNDRTKSNWFCGWGNFALIVDEGRMGEVYSKFFFQASFATTAITVVSRGMVERIKMEAYIIFSCLNTLLFSFPAHWIWDPAGWLYKLGVVDMAGAGPVHVVGGVTGLMATLILKPRHNRFESKTNPYKMGSPTNALLGLFMLWWGWLGFNCGSTFGISGYKWQLAARAAVTTFVASTCGGVWPCAVSYYVNNRQFDVGYIIQGVLGSLVSITAMCALAEPWHSAIIGSVGSLLALSSMVLMERLKIDDPVGCVGVHALGGIWGMVAVGIFAKEKDLSRDGDMEVGSHNAGLLYGGNGNLLGVQLGAALVIAVWSACLSYVILKALDVTLGLRLSLPRELTGADSFEHGIDHLTDLSEPTQAAATQDDSIVSRLSEGRDGSSSSSFCDEDNALEDDPKEVEHESSPLECILKMLRDEGLEVDADLRIIVPKCGT